MHDDLTNGDVGSEAPGRQQKSHGLLAGWVVSISGGLGLTLLVCAFGLTLWAVLWGRLPLGMRAVDWWGHQDKSRDDLRRLAVSVCVTALVILTAVLLERFVLRKHPMSMVMGLLLIGFLYWFERASNLPRLYHRLMDSFPVTVTVPVVFGAVVLAAIGTVAAFGWLLASTSSVVPATRGVVWGVVVGLVLAAGCVVWAKHAGDDRRFIDSTIAGTSSVPTSQLDSAGSRRFSLKVAPGTDKGSQASPDLFTTRTGFVVHSYASGITAYDTNGAERWHYRRTGPARVRVQSMRVLDLGTTVVAAVRDGNSLSGSTSLIGLDSDTGQTLWASDDVDLVAAYFERKSGNLRYLLNYAKDPRTWSLFDSRTGKKVWSIPAVDGECANARADVIDRVVIVTACPDKDSIDERFIAVDASTGHTIWESPKIPLGKTDPDNSQYTNVYVSRATNDSFFIQTKGLGLKTGSLKYVDLTRATITDFNLPGDAGWDMLSPTAASPYLFVSVNQRQNEQWNRSIELFDTSGQRRCTLSDDVSMILQGESRPSAYDSLYFPLADQILAATWDKDKTQNLSLINPSDCSQKHIIPLPNRIFDMMEAPGATLILRGSSDGIYVDGYS